MQVMQAIESAQYFEIYDNNLDKTSKLDFKITTKLMSITPNINLSQSDQKMYICDVFFT